MATKLSDIWQIINSKLTKDRVVSLQEIYTLIEDNIELQSDDFEPDAPDSTGIKWHRNVRNVLQQRKEQGDIVWFQGAEYLLPSSKNLVEIELSHRLRLWRTLSAMDNTKGISAGTLRKLRVYKGAQGIWIDKERTSLITEDKTGVTVSMLHTGSSYEDDLRSDHVIYHYPQTNRPATRDLTEINATKKAARLGLPVFLITYQSPNSPLRDVFLGWVTNWDDDSKAFTIVFGDEHPGESIDPENWLTLEDEITKPLAYPEGSTRRISVNVYERNPKARAECIAHYKAKCRICGFDFEEQYGNVGKGYIHIHHTKPLSEIGEEYEVDPIEDLMPVCPNCHAIIHKRKPPYNIEEVKAFLNTTSNNTSQKTTG